jgi:hypothetical protein
MLNGTRSVPDGAACTDGASDAASAAARSRQDLNMGGGRRREAPGGGAQLSTAA